MPRLPGVTQPDTDNRAAWNYPMKTRGAVRGELERRARRIGSGPVLSEFGRRPRFLRIMLAFGTSIAYLLHRIPFRFP